jgi:hypothetical protein
VAQARPDVLGLAGLLRGLHPPSGAARQLGELHGRDDGAREAAYLAVDEPVGEPAALRPDDPRPVLGVRGVHVVPGAVRLDDVGISIDGRHGSSSRGGERAAAAVGSLCPRIPSLALLFQWLVAIGSLAAADLSAYDRALRDSLAL